MYFTFNGEDSRDYGIKVTRSLFRESAPYRQYTTDTPGVDGSLIELKGYMSNVLYLDFVVEGDPQQVLKVNGWLSGMGKYTDSTYPGKYLNVDFQSEITPEKIAPNIYKINCSMYVHDVFWFKDNDQWTEPVNGIITNEGTAPARPLVKLTRNGDDRADVTVNETRFFYDFLGEREVYIDFEALDAYLDYNKRNTRLTLGPLPVQLNVGENKVISNTKIEFKRKDRWR